MARGKRPNYVRRPRVDDLRERLHNVRLSRKRVLIARGHLAASLTAQQDAVQRAFDGGATHRELAEALGRSYHKGWVAYGLKRTARR